MSYLDPTEYFYFHAPALYAPLVQVSANEQALMLQMSVMLPARHIEARRSSGVFRWTPTEYYWADQGFLMPQAAVATFDLGTFLVWSDRDGGFTISVDAAFETHDLGAPATAIWRFTPPPGVSALLKPPSTTDLTSFMGRLVHVSYTFNFVPPVSDMWMELWLHPILTTTEANHAVPDPYAAAVVTGAWI